LGIALAFWNNVYSRKETHQKSALNPQAQTSYAKKPQQANPADKENIQKEQTPGINEISKKEHIDTKKFRINEFAFISGYAQANLREKDDYEFIPAMFRFGFDLKPALKCANEKAMVQFAAEPFLNSVYSPNSNIEAGANFMLRLGYLLVKRIGAYVEAGAGVIYMTQHTREQSTQFNFTPQAGGGLYFYLNEERSIALNVGYRCRHLSNASIKQPNRGINANMVLVGLSWFFK